MAQENDPEIANAVVRRRNKTAADAAIREKKVGNVPILIVLTPRVIVRPALRRKDQLDSLNQKS